MSGTLKTRVAQFLAAHHVATLASAGGDGPWAAAVFYVNDGNTLYFLSSPNTRHCRNLKDDPRVAATMQDDCRDWQDIKGVQLEGQVSELSGDEETQARHLYAAKYPLVGQLARAPAAIVKALARVRWYRLTPARLYFIDNSQAFGQRDELDLQLND